MLSSVFILLAGSLICGIFLKERLKRLSPLLALGGSILLLIYEVLRSISIRFPALTSTYEGLIFMALSLSVLSLTLFKTGKYYKLYMTGLSMAVLLLAIASSPLFLQEARPPVPVLQSYWLVFHVALAFIGESLFTVAFIASLMWFKAKDIDKKKHLDRIIYQLILIGYITFTIGSLLFGAIWASYSWGRFWGWDPKETWALITWLTYTYYLHARLVSKSNSSKTQLISIIGFVFTIITLAGVQLLSTSMPSLHSY